MKLYYQDQTINIINCTSFLSRLKGFMFQKNINHALLFNKCNSIHTFFMKECIDVIMCDKDNKILFYYQNLPKNKIIWSQKGVTKVIETPPSYFPIKINTYLKMK